MLNRCKKFFCLVLYILLINIFLISLVEAYIGVTPASYAIDFRPGLKRGFHFTFLGDPDMKFRVYAAGDLAEYVKLSTDYLDEPGGVNVLLELPDEIEKPGTHEILIGAEQVSGDTQGGSMVGLVGNVMGVIRIKVPYPGKYAEIEFSASDANAGEPVHLSLKIRSLGKETINASSHIVISDSASKKIETVLLGSNIMRTGDSVEHYRDLNTSDWLPGIYNATAFVDYGGDKPAKASDIFRLGELYVEIINYTKEFDKRKINRFEIEVESFWNDPIENLFAEVSIIGYNVNFLTPSVNLKPWEKNVLTGFLDTTIFSDLDEFQAKIVVRYHGKTTEKIVDLGFKKEKIEYKKYGLIIGLVLAILILIIVLIKLWLVERKIKIKPKKFKSRGRK